MLPRSITFVMAAVGDLLNARAANERWIHPGTAEPVGHGWRYGLLRVHG